MTAAFIVRFEYPEADAKFEWRFAFFSSMVLPRILRQKTDIDFKIAIRCNPAHAERFRALSDRIITFTVKPGFENWIPEGYDPEKFEARRRRYFVDFVPWEAIEGLEKFDIQIGLDSDDLLLTDDYLDRIEAFCISKMPGMREDPSKSLHISFDPYIFQVPTLRTYTCPIKYGVDKGSAFFAIYQPDKGPGYRFAYETSHMRIGRLMHDRISVAEGFCAFSVHDRNESTYLYRDAKPIIL